MIHMHHQQHGLPYSADPVPALLPVDHAVFAEHQSRICEDTRSGFKIDTNVLPLI